MNYIILSLRNSNANKYEDELFKIYHFPKAYRKLINTDDIFVYYLSDTNTQEKSFIGYGKIGDIIKVDEGNFKANLKDCYDLIPRISYKYGIKNKQYVEMLGEHNPSKKIPAFQRSIRKLNFEAFDFIVNNSHAKKNRIELDNFDIPEFIEDYKELTLIDNVQAYEYNSQVNDSNNRSPLVLKRESNRLIYLRDPKLVKTVLVESEFKCAIKEGHLTFQSKANHQYSEGHHLIPMKYQFSYPTINLDHTDNIFSLCPICHNAIHYGSQSEKESRLLILFESNKFKEFLKKLSDIENFETFIRKFY